jgi:hypothetical protein
MKKITIKLILLALLVQTACAQAKSKPELPSVISGVFFKSYPNAQVKQWNFINNIYDIKYRAANKNHIAYFSHDGKWIKNETNFTFTHSLPPQVKNGLRANGFASYYFEKIREVDSVGNHYFAFLADSYAPSPNEDRGFFKQYDLYFSPEGKLVKKVLLPFD